MKAKIENLFEKYSVNAHDNQENEIRVIHEEDFKSLINKLIELFEQNRLVRTRNGKVANSGAPSVLIAYDHSNAESLRDSGIKGKFLWINK